MPDADSATAAWGSALLAVLLISLLSLVGSLALLVREATLRRVLPYLVALAVGAMLGSTFLHLIPELAHDGFTDSMGLKILAGVVIFFVLERYLHSHDHGHDHHAGVAPYAWLNLVGDGLHNFADGMIVATAWLQGPTFGIPVTIAVALHEIPQELGDIGILLHAGMRPRKAVLFNLLTAALAIAGALVALVLGGRVPAFTDTVLAVTAGGFIYVAAADLIPELHHGRRGAQSAGQVLLLIGGIAAMWALAHVHAH